MNPELIAAVKERLALGHSEEMIKEELRKTGYDEYLINQIIHEVALRHTVPIVTERIVFPAVTTLLRVGWSFAIRYTPIASLMSLPLVFLVLLVHFLGVDFNAMTGQNAVIGLATIVLYATYFLLFVAALRITVIDDGSRTVPIQEVWGWAKGNAAGLLWVSILTALVVWGGFMLLFIPGVIVSILIYFSQYVYVAEGVGGMKALLRSRELVKGHWVSLAGKIVSVGVIFVAIFITFGVVFGIIAAALGVDVWENSTGELVSNLIGQVINAFATLIALRVGMELYRTLASTRPATTDALVEGKGKYLALAWLGLFVPVILMVIIASSSHPLFSQFINEFRGNTTNRNLTNEEAKSRANELRHNMEI